MNNDYLSKFYELGYTHTELETLLKKIAEGELLTKEQYDILMAAVSIVTNLTTFDGSYDSLKNKPDIVDTVRQSNEFITYNAFDARAKTIYVSLEQTLKKLITDVHFELSESKSDIDHKHDDRYSLVNHNHEGLYVTQNDVKNYVTKDYLDSIVAGLGSGGGGGYYPVYAKPKLTVSANNSTVLHKVNTAIVINPTYVQNDAGELIKFSIRKNGETVYEGTEIKSYTDNICLMHEESITYTFVIEYGDGVIKNTVDDEPYPDTMIKAGSIVAGITIKGCANSYYGAISDKQFELNDINNLTPALIKTKGYTCSYKLNNQKSIYMYPESFGLLESIKDANGFEYINSYISGTINYDDVVYNTYVLTDAVTVDGDFKQIFK